MPDARPTAFCWDANPCKQFEQARATSAPSSVVERAAPSDDERGAGTCRQRAQPVHTKAPHVASRAHGAPCVVERATCLLVNLLACAFRFCLVGAYNLIGMRLGVVAVQQHGLKEVQLLDEDS